MLLPVSGSFGWLAGARAVIGQCFQATLHQCFPGGMAGAGIGTDQVVPGCSTRGAALTKGLKLNQVWPGVYSMWVVPWWEG